MDTNKAVLTDMSSKLLQSFVVGHLSFTINMAAYAAGMYLLKFENGVAEKIIKQ